MVAALLSLIGVLSRVSNLYAPPVGDIDLVSDISAGLKVISPQKFLSFVVWLLPLLFEKMVLPIMESKALLLS